MRRKNQRGLTLVELVVAFSIMMILTTMAVPLARSRVRIEREKELRWAEREIRAAIDKYKDYADAGYLAQQKLDSDNYPDKLETLVEGVKLQGQVDKKIRFLRRIPKDPFTNSIDWGMRSTQGRSDLQQLGRPERLRYIYQDHRKGARWNQLLRLVERAPIAGCRREFGFTMVELMIVMAIIVILVSIAIPQYQKALIRSKESCSRTTCSPCGR